ncbi:oxidoreductase [Vibrio nigripulchritudo]|uniref:aldo/keto reductase n=1 Tax=Vibrio nigripulchritudo TaxID=28173 RepID=UPI00190E3CA6|nr:aldo/keto reductase [Vibrio nigripulchritudo]BCL68117.1 oxidoreductase [Vibrio nigripulchritudo]BDU29445.1 oxidoreductase [Vibrio nigripulchritudo]
MSSNQKDKSNYNGDPLSDIEMIQGYWRMGEWGMSPAERLDFVKQHVELGITTVDHAAIYGSDVPCETLFGEALALEPSLREQLHIITKLGIIAPQSEGGIAYYDSGREEIISSVERSLKQLGVDHVDTLLLHRPDILLQPEEVSEAFEVLRSSGKVLNFGVSNFSTHEFASLQSYLDIKLVTNQVEINPINMQSLEDGTLHQLQAQRRRPMAWSCLAGGNLFNPTTDQHQRVLKVLEEIKEEVSAESIDQVVFAWVMALPSHPIPIIGSGKIERVKTAVAAKDITLTREQWYRVWTASKGHGVA